MGYKDIKEGNYVAKALAARVIESEKGTLGIEVAFEFTTQSATGQPQREVMNWVGWLSELAQARTMKTMVENLGYNGDESFGPGSINTKDEVQLVIKMEPDQEDITKVYPRIAWVNKIGGSAFAGLQPETVKSKLSAIGFKTLFKSAAAEAGKPVLKNLAPGANNPPELPKEPLPF